MQIAATLTDRRRTLRSDEATCLGQCGERGGREVRGRRPEVGAGKERRSVRGREGDKGRGDTARGEDFIMRERDSYFTRS